MGLPERQKPSLPSARASAASRAGAHRRPRERARRLQVRACGPRSPSRPLASAAPAQTPPQADADPRIAKNGHVAGNIILSIFPQPFKNTEEKKILAPEMYQNRDSRDVDRGPQIAGLSSWSLRFSLKLSVPSVRHRTRDHRAHRGTGPNARKPRERKTRRRRRSPEMSRRRRAQGPALRSP